MDTSALLPAKESQSRSNPLPSADDLKPNQSASQQRTLIDWKPVPGQADATLFSALDSSSGNSVAVHLFPSLVAEPERRGGLERQAKLIEIVGGTVALPIIESQFDVTPPRVVVLTQDTLSLTEFLATATELQTLEVAASLFSSVERTAQRGLVHPTLVAESIRVRERTTQVLIDYVLSNRCLSIEHDRPIANGDSDLYVHALHTMVKIVSSALSGWVDSGPSELLAGRRRAELRRLIRDTETDAPNLKNVDRWRTFLSEWTVQNPDSVDQLDAASRMVEEELSDGIDNDRTCEIQIISEVQDSDPDTTREIEPTQTPTLKSRPAIPAVGERLGRFELIEEIGQGGMGVVFRGTDLTTGDLVAVKVLKLGAGDITQAVRRFTKEGRLLATIQNPFVTQLYEVGVDRGHHYLAMEFVDGVDLKSWILDKLPLPQPEAISVVADIARALVDAHSREIVHRDIKPENVLLAKRIPESNSVDLREMQVKLTDFGIARQIDQSESMAVTRAGALLGTPLYMSPEQFKGTESVSPASDIYALGITLYQLLCGETPFKADDPMQLAAMHCFDQPVNIQKRNRDVTDEVATVVHRMLAKKPSGRFADAAQLIRELDRIQSGQPSGLDVHPKFPETTGASLWEKTFQWDLQSSPDALWPHVSNTDRLNRAIGLPAVRYRTEKDERLGLRKFGSFKIGGMQVSWEEHPFEWVEGSRLGVLREFDRGPFKWFMSTVELRPKPDGGTHLVHTVRIQPRNTVGRVVSTIEAGWKGGRALDRVYKRIDTSIQAKKNELTSIDPFEAAGSLLAKQQSRLTQRLELLIQQGVTPETADKLEDFLRTAPAQALTHVRPIQLADDLQVDADEMLSACLIAASCDLLVLEWDVLCPTCRAPASTERILSSIDAHTECEACDVEFQSNVGNAIELVFRVHPEIRDADNAQYCVGGPGHAPHVVSQLRVTPGERLEFEIPVTEGDYILRGPRLSHSQPFSARTTSAPSHLDLCLKKIEQGNHSAVVRAGRLTLCLTNDFDTTQVVRVERTISRSNVITAAVASTHALFRRLFPEQLMGQDVPVATEQVTLLATTVNNIDSLYSELADQAAYQLTQQLLATIERVVQSNRGSVVKTSGENVLAAFSDASDAFEVAMSLADQIQSDETLRPLRVGFGIHRGRTLVTTQNGRLDYFGTATRIAGGLANLADGSVLLADSIFTDSAIVAHLNKLPLKIETDVLSVPGSPNQVVQRIALLTVTGS